MTNILKCEPGPPMALNKIGTTRREAATVFARTYGHPPKMVIVTGGGTLAGPKPERHNPNA